jgi:hypothetical protein
VAEKLSSVESAGLHTCAGSFASEVVHHSSHTYGSVSVRCRFIAASEMASQTADAALGFPYADMGLSAEVIQIGSPEPPHSHGSKRARRKLAWNIQQSREDSDM